MKVWTWESVRQRAGTPSLLTHALRASTCVRVWGRMKMWTWSCVRRDAGAPSPLISVPAECARRAPRPASVTVWSKRKVWACRQRELRRGQASRAASQLPGHAQHLHKLQRNATPGACTGNRPLPAKPSPCIRNPHHAVRNPHHAVRNPHHAVRNQALEHSRTQKRTQRALRQRCATVKTAAAKTATAVSCRRCRRFQGRRQQHTWGKRFPADSRRRCSRRERPKRTQQQRRSLQARQKTGMTR
eukprot:361619-Chlamydomonas_euryale.AAC.5